MPHDPPPHDASPRPPLSLSIKTLIGLLLGLAAGIFFGEPCGNLQGFGRAFVGLLQMTVLPYVSLSLIVSVGRLTPPQAARLGGKVGLTLTTDNGRQNFCCASNQRQRSPDVCSSGSVMTIFFFFFFGAGGGGTTSGCPRGA